MLKNPLKPFAPHKTKRIITDDITEKHSYKFANLLGYIILTLMVVDYGSLLIPPQFFNPTWEIETIGEIIETVFVTLLGFMLIFFRPQQQSIKHSELKILALLSWLALILGIICFLLTPLLISNCLRLNANNQAQINLQLANQNQQFEQATLDLNKLNNEQIQNLWVKANQNSAPTIAVTQQKQQLVTQIQQRQQATKQQLQQSLKNNQLSLFKMTFKWMLGAIIAGVYFVYIWQYTKWVREVWTLEKKAL